MGCVPNTHPDLYVIDYSWSPGLDLCWDITKGIPIQQNIARGGEGGFSEHCLEHVSFTDCLAVTKEFHRIMKEGAALRIVVPDGELYTRKYPAGERMPYEELHEQHGVYGPFMSVNEIFYNHGHKYIYDFVTMRNVLESTGFKDVEKASFRTGGDPVLFIDSESRAVESLYVTARN